MSSRSASSCGKLLPESRHTEVIRYLSDINGVQVSLDVVNNDLRPKIPDGTPEPFAKLMRKCWERQPTSRPNFYEIIKDLEHMKLPTRL